MPNTLIPIVNSMALTTKGKNKPMIIPELNELIPLHKVHLKYDLLITPNNTIITIKLIMQTTLVKVSLKVLYVLINCFVPGVAV